MLFCRTIAARTPAWDTNAEQSRIPDSSRPLIFVDTLSTGALRKKETAGATTEMEWLQTRPLAEHARKLQTFPIPMAPIAAFAVPLRDFCRPWSAASAPSPETCLQKVNASEVTATSFVSGCRITFTGWQLTVSPLWASVRSLVSYRATAPVEYPTAT